MASFYAQSLTAAALLALSTVGTSQVFEDVTFRSGLTSIPLDVLGDGTGMVPGDFDGDNDLDLVIPGNPGTLIRLFRNNGDMWFSDRTWGAGLGVSRGARAVQAADVDNDGDLDIFIGNEHQVPQLFINDGQAKFSEEAASRGLTHITSNCSATFGDYDKDGFVDLYIGNRFAAGSSNTTEANILYRNLGDGRFVDVTQSAGVGNTGATTASAFIDYDQDGLVDLFVVNDKGYLYGANELYRNLGDGTFTARGQLLNASAQIAARGVDFADVFNDGGVDYLVGNANAGNLFKVAGAPGASYINGTNLFDLGGSVSSTAVRFADFDNDGWQDVYVVNSDSANQVLRNPGMAASTVTPWTGVPSAIAPTQAQTTAIVADFDGDGRVDVLHRFLAGANAAQTGLAIHRNVGATRHYLKIRTYGTTSNGAAIGARVVVRSATKTQSQQVRTGVGYLSGADLALHFGLGDETVVDVDVHWPSGFVQTLEGVDADQTFDVFEPEFKLIGEPIIGGACFLDVRSGTDIGSHYAILFSTQRYPEEPLPGGKTFPLHFDWLTHNTLGFGNGLVWGNVSTLEHGWGQALMTIPRVPQLVGYSIYSAAFTYDPLEWPLLTIFPNTLEITFKQ